MKNFLLLSLILCSLATIWTSCEPEPTNGEISLSGNMNFGSVTLGSSAILNLTISNIGSGPLTVSNISLPNGFVGSWSGTINGGGSQQVVITFTPSTVTTYSGTLNVDSDASIGVNTLGISGSGNGMSGQSVIALSGNLDFGSVSSGGSENSNLTISNTGSVGFTVSSLSLPAGFTGSWSGMINGGSSQQVVITFTPTAASTYNGTLIVNSNVSTGTNTMVVSGTGIVSSGTSFTDSRDGETYATVTIGSQIWMAENLRYNASGSGLNTSNPSAAYGRLYTWVMVMDGALSSSSSPSGVQGICPGGWHLPSDVEWKTLEISLGLSVSDADLSGQYRGTHGTGMKSATGWSSGAGTNTSGFSGVPAGTYYSGSFYDLEDYTGFWSSTEYSSTLAWSRSLFYLYTGVERDSDNKAYGYPCRCAKD